MAEGSWRLPQLLAANWLSNNPSKRPYLTWAALLTCPTFLVYTLMLSPGIALSPISTLILFFVALTIRYAALAMDSIVWPVVGGWLLGPTSYSVLFGLTAG